MRAHTRIGRMQIKRFRERVLLTKWWIQNAHPFTETWKNKQKLSKTTLLYFWREAKLYSKQTKAEQSKRQLKMLGEIFGILTCSFSNFSLLSSTLEDGSLHSQCGTVVPASEESRAYLIHNEMCLLLPKLSGGYVKD